MRKVVKQTFLLNVSKCLYWLLIAGLLLINFFLFHLTSTVVAFFLCRLSSPSNLPNAIEIPPNSHLHARVRGHGRPLHYPPGGNPRSLVFLILPATVRALSLVITVLFFFPVFLFFMHALLFFFSKKKNLRSFFIFFSVCVVMVELIAWHCAGELRFFFFFLFLFWSSIGFFGDMLLDFLWFVVASCCCCCLLSRYVRVFFLKK